jgi:flagellar motor switch protein FliM
VASQTAESKENVQVKKYDFRSPKKFSKDVISTIEMVHDSYARIISSFLTAQIRTNVQAKVAIVDQVTYEEFIRSVSSPTILSTYIMPPFTGTLLMETSPQFVFQILDIMFGGAGTIAFKAREFTEIEKSVIRSINEKLIENLKLAWEDIMDVQPQFLDIETNPALNQTMAPSEPVAIVTLSIKINGVQTYINMCIPYMAIEKVMDKMMIRYRFSGLSSEEDNSIRQRMEKRVQGVHLDLKTVLGNTNIPIRSFLDLQVGDVIQLDKKAGDPLETYVEGMLHYKVLPGTLSKKKAVQIVEIIDKDVDEYE